MLTLLCASQGSLGEGSTVSVHLFVHLVIDFLLIHSFIPSFIHSFRNGVCSWGTDCCRAGAQIMGQGLWDPRARPSLPVWGAGKTISARDHLSRVLRDEEELAREAFLPERMGNFWLRL